MMFTFSYPSQTERLTQLEVYLCAVGEESAYNIKVLKSLEGINGDSDGGTDSFIQLFRLKFILFVLW